MHLHLHAGAVQVSGGTPGSCSHCLSVEDLPGEGRLPKDASLDLHPPLRSGARTGTSVPSGEAPRLLPRGAHLHRTHLHRTCGVSQVQVCGAPQVQVSRGQGGEVEEYKTGHCIGRDGL